MVIKFNRHHLWHNKIEDVKVGRVSVIKGKYEHLWDKLRKDFQFYHFAPWMMKIEGFNQNYWGVVTSTPLRSNVFDNIVKVYCVKRNVHVLIQVPKTIYYIYFIIQLNIRWFVEHQWRWHWFMKVRDFWH